MAFLSGTVFANAVNGLYHGKPIVNLIVEGEKVNSKVPAFIMDGTTMVPIRVITETLGMEVGWEQDAYTANIVNPNKPPVIEDVSEINPDSPECKALEEELDQALKAKSTYLKKHKPWLTGPAYTDELQKVHNEYNVLFIEAKCIPAN